MAFNVPRGKFCRISTVLVLIAFLYLVTISQAFATNPRICQCLNILCFVDNHHSTDPAALRLLQTFDSQASSWLPPELRDDVMACINGTHSPHSLGAVMPYLVLIPQTGLQEAHLPQSGARFVPDCNTNTTFSIQISTQGSPFLFFERLRRTLHRATLLATEISLAQIMSRQSRYFQASRGRVHLQVLDITETGEARPHFAQWTLHHHIFHSNRGHLSERYMPPSCFRQGRSGLNFNIEPPTCSLDSQTATLINERPSVPSLVAPTFASSSTQRQEYETQESPHSSQIQGTLSGDAADEQYRLNQRTYCRQNPNFWRCRNYLFRQNPTAYCQSHSDDFQCIYRQYRENPQRFCLNNPNSSDCQFHANPNDYCDHLNDPNGFEWRCIENNYNRHRDTYCQNPPNSSARAFCDHQAYLQDPNYCQTHPDIWDCQRNQFFQDPNYCQTHPHFSYCIEPDIGEEERRNYANGINQNSQGAFESYLQYLELLRRQQQSRPPSSTPPSPAPRRTPFDGGV